MDGGWPLQLQAWFVVELWFTSVVQWIPNTYGPAGHTARPLRQWKNIPGICSGLTFSLLNATALHTRYSFCSMFTVLLYDSVMIRSKWLLSPLEDSNCHKTLFGCSWSCPNKVKHHCRIVMSGLCPLVSPREMVLLSTLVAFFHHLFWAQ